MRQRAFLLVAAAGLFAAAPGVLIAAPVSRRTAATPVSAASDFKKTRYYRQRYYYAPYGHGRDAYDAYDDALYRPFGYYGAVPCSSYYNYYQTYGCYAPDRYCVYYNW